MRKTVRLIWQLYPTYLLITLLSLGAVGCYTSIFLRAYLIQRTTSGLKNHARLIEVMIEKHLDPLDSEGIDQICHKIAATSATRVTVMLPDGTVIGDSGEEPEIMENHLNRKEIKIAISGKVGSSQRYSKTLQKRMMYVAMPLKKAGKLNGVLRTSIPLTDIDTELHRIQRNIALGGLLIAALAAAISFFVSQRISKPIEKLRQGAQNFAKGDLSQQLQIPRTKETAGLAEAMNFMAGRLEKRIEAEINQRNEMEAILASMSEGVIAIDMDERVLSFNQAATGIVGWLKNSVKGRRIQEVIREVAFQEFLKRTVENNVLVSEDITLYQSNNRMVNVQATPIFNSHKSRVGTLLVLNDVTQLRHLEKMRQDFVANVSHEIKTPLTAIKGFVETLLHGVKDNPEEAEHFISIIQKHANRLEAIVVDLLQLSKIEKENEARQIPFAKESIYKIIKSAAQLCQSKADEKGIRLNIAYDASIEGKVNAPLLEQALLNLVDNAIKYSNEGDQIWINLEQTSEALIIAIKDNGVGIDKKHLPRLFERFYRVDKARSREQGGTGLGLAIVKNIVQAHGGKIIVESKRSEGSTFTIHLPVV